MNTQTKQRMTLLVILIIVVIGIGYLWAKNKNTVKNPPVIEVPNTVVKPVAINGAGTDTVKDLLAFSITAGSKLHGIVSYRGTIQNGYFFEGNILINVLDVNKKVLKNSNAMATTEWMTSGPVEFEGNIDFTNLAKGPGYIEIHNDNASGLPEKDKSVLIPITIE